MKPNKESHCRICSAALDPVAESRGAIYGLCLIHACIATEPLHQRLALGQIIDELRRDHLRIVLDANGAGWLRKVEPKPAPRSPAFYDDDGTPRYTDTASPHGLTIRPELDNLVGGNLSERLEKLRTPEAGDGDF
jgi:hypothetical protein